MFSQPRSRSTANSRNSFVYRLFATRSFLSCKCAISVCLKIGVQSSQSDSQLILSSVGTAVKRAAVSGKLLKVRDTDGFRKQFR